jgi:hypothetical protein
VRIQNCNASSWAGSDVTIDCSIFTAAWRAHPVSVVHPHGGAIWGIERWGWANRHCGHSSGTRRSQPSHLNTLGRSARDKRLNTEVRRLVMDSSHLSSVYTRLGDKRRDAPVQQFEENHDPWVFISTRSCHRSLLPTTESRLRSSM